MCYQLRKRVHYLLGVLLFVLTPFLVVGQDYVLLADASGFDRSSYVAQLEEATAGLKDVVDEVNLFYNTTLLDVDVFDFGFYLYNPLFENGISDAIDIAKSKAASQSSQYILLAKESGDNKIYSKLHFEVNLPEGHNCYTNEKLETSIQEYIDYHNYNSSPFDVMEFQVELLTIITNQIKILYICCVPEGNDINLSSRKKNLQETTCDGVDLLVQHNEGLAKDYILNFLSCLDYSSEVLATTIPGEGLYTSINNLSRSSVFNGCHLPEGIVHCYKTDDSNPGSFIVRSPIESSTYVDCPNFSGVPNTTDIDVWDYGAFKIYTTQNFNLNEAIIELSEGEFLEELKDVIDVIYNQNELSGDNVKILGRGIGCQLSQLDFNYKFKLLLGLLEIDDKEGILSAIINAFYPDYSSLLFYVIESINDYQTLFIKLKDHPEAISKLIEYDLDSGYEVDLKILILTKYKEVITNPNTLLKVTSAVTIPFTVDKVLVIFQDPNFDFQNNQTTLQIDVTDYSAQSTVYGQYGFSYTYTWESQYPENLNYLDPLILPQLQISGENIAYSNYVVPAFLMPSISSDIDNENVKQALLVAVDVGSLFIGGVGFFKLAATGVVRARQLKLAISGTQTVLGTTNLFLRLNEDCQNNNTCKEIATYLTILELISITPDLYAVSKSALFKSVDDLVEVTADASKIREIRAAQNLEYLNTRVDKLADVPPNLKSYLSANKIEFHILNELDDAVLAAIAKDIPVSSFNSKMDDLVADLISSKANTNGVDDLISFLNSNPNGVKAWDFLTGSPVIRRQVANLEKMTEVLEVRFFETAGITDDVLRTGIRNSSTKAKMIDRLNEASKEGSSVEDFLDAYAAKGRAIDHTMETPVSQMDEVFDDLNPNATTSEFDSKWTARQQAGTKQEKIVASEALGEARVDQIYESKGWERLDVDGVPPGKQGKFDRIYEDPNGVIHVVEAKGGAANFGSRVTELGDVAQQGSKQYRDDIISNLRTKLGAQHPLIQKLDDAIVNDELVYVLVNQKTTAKSNFSVKLFPE